MPIKKVLIRLIIAALVVFGLIQLVPYGRSHTNPPVTAEPVWDIPQTQALAVRACFDCHSNLTTWPWYSNIAPVSWLVQRDVDQGRRRLNFSQWRALRESGELSEVVSRGSMPPWFYVIQHPGANLSAAEKTQLEAGLNALK